MAMLNGRKYVRESEKEMSYSDGSATKKFLAGVKQVCFDKF